MFTSLQRLIAVVAGLSALAVLPAAAHAQRFHPMPPPPRPMPFVPHSPISPMVRADLVRLNRLNLALTPTSRAALTSTATVLNRVAMLDANRAAFLVRSAAQTQSPIQKAVWLNRAAALDIAAVRNSANANVLNRVAQITPAQIRTAQRNLLIGQALVNRAELLNGLERMALFSGYNPYTTMAVPTMPVYPSSMVPATNPYASGNPGYSSGYGYPMYPSSSSNQQSSNQQSNPYIAPAEESPATVLDALGVPTKNGHLSWPLGLRIVAPAPKAAALRQQIDAIIQIGAAQPDGQVSAGTVQLATDATEQLRAMLKKNSGSVAMAEPTLREANQFLDRLEVSLLAMRK